MGRPARGTVGEPPPEAATVSASSTFNESYSESARRGVSTVGPAVNNESAAASGWIEITLLLTPSVRANSRPGVAPTLRTIVLPVVLSTKLRTAVSSVDQRIVARTE